MMNCPQVEERLYDYVDGVLPPKKAREVASHLGDCERCRAEAEAVRALLARAASLAREIPPHRDLWPEIASRVGSSDRRLRPPASWSKTLLLAASVLVVLLAGVLSLVAIDRGVENSGGGLRGAEVEGLLEAEEEFTAARLELRKALEEDQDSIAPETRQVIEENLAIIDEAIGSIHSALEEDPGNPALEGLLVATYRREVHLLQRANHLQVRR